MSDTATGADAQQQQQSALTESQLRAVLDEYQLARSADVATNSQKVDAVALAVQGGNQTLDALAAESGTSSVVVIDSQQWETMQSCWNTCKASMQVGLFLVLVLALLVASVLGSRLWGAFSKGWRR